ncbi:hypothetical protein CEXT_103041 [Caerostris extrusa]|uniref:Uncharacterized protein n=1 Tax=Caerostris extrusa TaxID=172846 RepID=A0AAV4X6Y3_CAEEX|nr:hypothetical protein CEXT_103041 [Caerostris extrusa]
MIVQEKRGVTGANGVKPLADEKQMIYWDSNAAQVFPSVYQEGPAALEAAPGIAYMEGSKESWCRVRQCTKGISDIQPCNAYVFLGGPCPLNGLLDNEIVLSTPSKGMKPF